MSEDHSLEVIAQTILSSTPVSFRFLKPESLSFEYDAKLGNEPPYFAALSGFLLGVRQAPFENEPIDHLHLKALPFLCEQLAYVLAAKLILDKKVPGLEYMTLSDIAREKKEILRAAKSTYSFQKDIPLADNTILKGWVGLQDKPFMPEKNGFYSGRMDVVLCDARHPDVPCKANYHIVRMNK